MDVDLWVRLAVFMAAGFVTPGPNTMMVLASGINFGFQRTIPHILGVVVGTFGLFVLVGFGLAALLAVFPGLKIAVQVLGIAYLLYLAYRIATAVGPSDAEKGEPFTFLQAIAIQAVNVKLMGIAASVMVNYPLVSAPSLNIGLIGLTAALVNGPCVALWGVFGSRLRHLLNNPRILRVVNICLALLIVMTLIPLAMDVWVSLKG